jgi:TIR domain
MKVFISWSGRRSKKIAESLRDLLKGIDESIEPFLSTEIEKGRVWYQEIEDALRQSDAAIICLTPENRDSSWIHFEAGAMECRLHGKDRQRRGVSPKPRVFPYLYPVGPIRLSGPLAQYQATTADKEDTKRLVEFLFDLMEGASESWGERFNKGWNRFEQSIARVWLSPAEVLDDLEQLFDRKTFRESVRECTAQNWADRFAGARETYGRLRDSADEVKASCRRYHQDLFRELVAEVDGYAMALSSLVLGQRWTLRDDGTLDIPKGVGEACEKRRTRIEDLVSRLLDPVDVPYLDEAWRFRNADENEQRSLVHRKIQYIRNHREVLRRTEALRDWSQSEWAFDRIAYYLAAIEAAGTRRRLGYEIRLSESLKRELQKVASEPGALLSLEWCLRAAAQAPDEWLEMPQDATAVDRLLGPVEEQTEVFGSLRQLVQLVRQEGLGKRPPTKKSSEGLKANEHVIRAKSRSKQALGRRDMEAKSATSRGT